MPSPDPATVAAVVQVAGSVWGAISGASAADKAAEEAKKFIISQENILFDKIMTKYIPNFSQQVPIKMPKLKKLSDSAGLPKLKTNIEKTIQGLQTNLKEFRYENGGFVKPNTLYSIYYTLTKQEIYLTGIQNSSISRIIRKDKPDT